MWVEISEAVIDERCFVLRLKRFVGFDDCLVDDFSTVTFTVAAADDGVCLWCLNASEPGEAEADEDKNKSS